MAMTIVLRWYLNCQSQKGVSHSKLIDVALSTSAVSSRRLKCRIHSAQGHASHPPRSAAKANRRETGPTKATHEAAEASRKGPRKQSMVPFFTREFSALLHTEHAPVPFVWRRPVRQEFGSLCQRPENQLFHQGNIH